MNKIKEFFKSKAFYVAFGTGILAFSGLLLMYNYSDNREGLKREQAIDLNQPIESDEVADNTNQQELNKAQVQPVESDGVLTNDEVNKIVENTESKAEKEDALQNINNSTETDAASGSNVYDRDKIYENVVVDVVSDGSIISEYNYEGDQSLAWPVAGNIILPYSMDTTVYYSTLGSYKCNPGMLIAGDEGEDVVAAYDGVVESVTEDKEHGTMVNIDMGNGYIATYGQLMNVTVGQGDKVVLGENIGEIAPTTSYYTMEGNHLYFEINKDGEPVNPLNYIQ